jgi:uncharacterized membrane protein YhdT
MRIFIVLLHAFTGWALCALTIGVGRSVTSMENTLIIHALLVPVIFTVISFVYFKKFHYTTPLQTALIFVAFAVFMDAVIVAQFIEKSYRMFLSPLGTWIPLASIFIVTCLAGRLVNKS